MALDLETTGTDPQKDKIIEVGMVKLVDGVETASYHSLVNPGMRLPVKVKRLTGITDEMLLEAPGIEEILPEVIEFIGDNPLLGHNVQFDRNFISAAMGRSLANPINNVIYDTVELARIVLPNAANHRLETLCKLCAVDLPVKHRALEDARGAAFLAVELVHRLSMFEIPLLLDLITLLEKSHSPWFTVIQQVGQRKAKEFSNRRIATITGLRPPKEELVFQYRNRQGEDGFQPVDENEVSSYLGQDGLLSKVIKNYEYRPQQLAMARAVTRSLNNGHYLLSEAGTGTGKSMAYLLPSVLWAKKNRQKVVLSTHTINLQEQLCHKDVPLLQSLSGMNFKACLVKGRSNFLCLRRWYAALGDKNINSKEAGFYARILVWLTLTDTGDRSELNFYGDDFELWKNVCAESDGCLGKKCRYFRRMCFVNRLKRRAEQADIIIANHSLVFSDIAVESRVLPAYKVLVIDEAHHLEDAATKHLGTEVNRAGVARWLTRVSKITARLAELPAPGEQGQWLENMAGLKELQYKVREAAEIFFAGISHFLAAKKQNPEQTRCTVRLKKGTDFSSMQVEIENLVQRINSLSEHLQKTAAEIEGQMIDGESEVAREAALVAEAGLVLAADISFTCDCNSDITVHWIEGEVNEEGAGHISIHAVPVKVGELLHSTLYSEKNCVIFTSATLTVDGSFDHFIERSGLNLLKPDKLKTLRVDSPFAYDRQSLLYVLNDLPAPGTVPEEEYLQSLAEVIGEIAAVSGGRTLVLFTAHKVLKKVYYCLKPQLEEQDILLLGHDIDGGRTRLVEEFKESERAVLFGAASFWEGLDIPGRALSCVVLVKLPFWPPNVPVVEARLEALAKENKDGFRHFSLPEAVIKFKQGFGRLIRTGYDRGAVIILDKRIVNKRYGQKFLNSLPVSSHMRGNKIKMLNNIKNWLYKVE